MFIKVSSPRQIKSQSKYSRRLLPIKMMNQQFQYLLAQQKLNLNYKQSASMNNGLLIALAIIFVIILMAINIYLLALYIHTDDKGFGTALYCKILVVVGLTLCQAQALLVPLDVANASAIDQNGIDMKGFWYFIYATVIIFICLLMPFALFFYETDQDQGFCKRTLRSIIYTIIANIVSVLLIFITWNFFKFVELPLHTISSDGKTSTSSINPDFTTWAQKENDVTLQIQASFAVYIVAIMSFFGWICVVICGGVGLFALPLDMINQFRNRPKARRTGQMNETKKQLGAAVHSLIKEGEEMKKNDEDHAANSQAGWFNKWRGKRTLDNKLTEFKAKFFTLQEQVQLFNLQLKFYDSNPIVPYIKLLLGIVFLVTSLLWVLQIIFGNIAKGFNRPLIPFLNELFIGLDNGNAGFLATGLFAYFCLYLLWCVQKGTVKFGVRIPCCCRFHPMKENQTWMNSFIFNVIIMLIASVGVIQLCISSFPTYTRNTQIYTIIALQLNYMKFYSAFYQNNVFPIAFVIWTGLSCIFLCLTCNKKPEYMRELQRIRKTEKDQD